MHRGRVVETGATQEVLDNPKADCAPRTLIEAVLTPPPPPPPSFPRPLRRNERGHDD